MAKASCLKSWQLLEEHQQQIKPLHLRQLFSGDPQRFEKLSLRLDDLLFDFSKQRITTTSIALLCNLAEEAGLRTKIQRMFSGEKINQSEQRAALHTALRNGSEQPILVDGTNVMPQIKAMLGKMREFTEQVRSGRWRGHSGRPITDIVNIGIGGSDLGPLMVCEALKPYGHPDLQVHFVSNIDATDLFGTLAHLDPHTTLFLIASKTFTTQETLTNAHTAKQWLLQKLPEESAVARHFVAISSNQEKVRDFGIAPQNMFEFWDWVGGRYSLWSAIGLSIALYVGMDNFERLLQGAQQIDTHFRKTPFQENIPVIMGLLSIWNGNFLDVESHAILPYDQSLHRLPAYLQQADMESCGKQTSTTGEPLDYHSGPIIWGEPGTNGQHAFYQLLHQGTRLISADFIAAAESQHTLDEHHQLLLANFFAQPEALMRGKTGDEVRAEMLCEGLAEKHLEQLLPQRTFPGNRPSSSLLLRKLTPTSLGQLIALYEHKIFTQAAIWDINPFDQWGVELGKQLAKQILPELNSSQPVASHDNSTNGLINHYRQLRRRS